jgi:uncharacterized protein (DUF488 family)
MIYTTYFAKLKKLPENIIPIAICAKPPVGYVGPIYRPLAPKYDFFAKYKINGDKEEFTENYIGQVLNQLNPVSVVTNLYYQACLAPNTCDIALVCFEKSSDFCHRHLVAEWLREAGYACEEWSEN